MRLFKFNFLKKTPKTCRYVPQIEGNFNPAKELDGLASTIRKQRKNIDISELFQINSEIIILSKIIFNAVKVNTPSTSVVAEDNDLTDFEKELKKRKDAIK